MKLLVLMGMIFLAASCGENNDLNNEEKDDIEKESLSLFSLPDIRIECSYYGDSACNSNQAASAEYTGNVYIVDTDYDCSSGVPVNYHSTASAIWTGNQPAVLDLTNWSSDVEAGSYKLFVFMDSNFDQILNINIQDHYGCTNDIIHDAAFSQSNSRIDLDGNMITN